MPTIDVSDPHAHRRAGDRLLCYKLLLMLVHRGRSMRCDAARGLVVVTDDGREWPHPFGEDPEAVRDFEVMTREAGALEPRPLGPGASRSFGVRLSGAEFVATLRVEGGDPPAGYTLDLESPPGLDREAQAVIRRCADADDEPLTQGDDGTMVFAPRDPKRRHARGPWWRRLLG